MKFTLIATAGMLTGWMLLAAGVAQAVDSTTAPRPVPLTRPEMKQYLEDMKGRKPRIPLPELTAEDRQALGERLGSYESRLRYHYLPAREGRAEGRGAPAGGARGAGGGFGFSLGREADPDLALDSAFRTQLFWIVSRTNNCQYCLGHQESKLLGAGMTEDEIAALDGDWAQFQPRTRAAYAFARRITYEPHRLDGTEIAELKKYYTDKQILEMILSVAANNAINRWKEGAGIPQSAGGGNFGGRRPGSEAAGTERPARTETAHSYLTPTSEKFQQLITRVAPLSVDPRSGEPTRDAVCDRPALETRDAVEQALRTARQRTARLPLVDEADVRNLLPEGFPDGPLPRWVLLLANFPHGATSRIANIRGAEERGDLSPLLKAQVSWIIARHDRAWYAAAEAKRRLQQLDWSADQIYLLDGSWNEFTPTERALFNVARKLAASPVVLTDADVEEAVRLAGPRDVVQLISYTTHRASFDRITEAAGLPADK
ncbi:MAG: carboxymuconolactone decarboxylase family protein [Pirellulaceae bacterium]|nr:carboxymuconolactone decarboxylase family protein [Pirellulaceae bacterium]